MNARVLQDLRESLAALHRYAPRLTPADATPELLRELDQGLTLARRLVAAVGKFPTTGCREHPDGPVDHGAGGCLLCNTRRRARTADPPRASVDDVLAAIEEHGRDEALLRYGARPVAHALAAAGRGTTSRRPRRCRPASGGPAPTDT